MTERREVIEHRPGGAAFWACVVVGWAAMAFGVGSALLDAEDARPFELARWVIGAALVHDLVVAPLVLLVGVVIGRLVRGPLRGPLQGGLVASAVVVAFAWPFVRRYGGQRGNASALPRDYTAGLLVGLAVVWTVVALVAAWSWWRARAATPSANGT